MTNTRSLRSRVFTGLLLSVVAAAVAFPYIPAQGAPPPRSKIKLHLPARYKHPNRKQAPPPPVVANTLLIMPNKGDADDAMQKIREVNGTIVRVIGSGEMTTWVVQFESQEKFIEAEKELFKDKHVKKMQRDYMCKPMALNDPYYGSEYYLQNLNVEAAWAQSNGSTHPNSIIGVIDTGVNTKCLDLIGKVYPGYDCNHHKDKQTDKAGHGTMVSTTAAAIGDNAFNTAGPARLSQIYPICAYSKALGYFPDDNLIEAVYQAGQRGLKIINMSLNADPPYTLANPAYSSVLQTYFQDFHDNKGGLIFNSCGNSSTEDTTAPTPSTASLFNPDGTLKFLIVVSAVDESNAPAWFTTYGNVVWFAAPGTNIVCSSKNGKGKIVSVNGTSFSCPLTASIASLIWGANPNMTNLQVEQKLISTAVPFGAPGHDRWFGYGVPDAAAAMYAALH